MLSCSRTKQRKARHGPGNTARVTLSLHFRWQFVYPQFVYWFVVLQGIKTEGVWGCDACPVDHRRLWGRVWVIMSCHFHRRQSVYPRVVYSAPQLATTEVMFSSWCSLIPRLSLSWLEPGNEATSILGEYCTYGWAWVPISNIGTLSTFVLSTLYLLPQLATTEVMFSTWCSFIPWLSPRVIRWTGACMEGSYKYTL